MSFVKRRIDVTIQLGTGTFGETVGNTVTLEDHRVAFEAEYVGGISQGEAHIRIYGLPLTMINQLTHMGPVAQQLIAQNKIQIDAGDEGEKLTTVFIGSIMTAYGEFQDAPDVPLVISAYTAMVAALKPVGASSYVGSVKAEKCMADFAKEMGFAFENNGVSVPLSNPYFPGCTLDKIRECAQAARINYSTDNGVLAIWPRGGHRSGGIPVISPKNGMIGYPVFSSSYLAVRSLFRPDLVQGGQFEIKDSEIKKAHGVWNVSAVFHHLESQAPDGSWFTTIMGYKPLT